MVMQHFDTNICFNLSGARNYLASRSLFVSTCGEECWCLAVLQCQLSQKDGTSLALWHRHGRHRSSRPTRWHGVDSCSGTIHV